MWIKYGSADVYNQSLEQPIPIKIRYTCMTLLSTKIVFPGQAQTDMLQVCQKRTTKEPVTAIWHDSQSNNFRGLRRNIFGAAFLAWKQNKIQFRDRITKLAKAYVVHGRLSRLQALTNKAIASGHAE